MLPEAGMAAAIAAHLANVTRVTRQIARVNAQITAWEEHLANRELPAAVRRLVPRPDVPLADLKELHAALVATLVELTEGR